jgi:hypothetical protein
MKFCIGINHIHIEVVINYINVKKNKFHRFFAELLVSQTFKLALLVRPVLPHETCVQLLH